VRQAIEKELEGGSDIEKGRVIREENIRGREMAATVSP